MIRTDSLGVAVFARTPGSGGKSRLAATWGRENTDRFYDYCLGCVTDWLGNGSNLCHGYWALTGPGSRSTAFWKNGKILEQPEGSLGSRMYGIADQLYQRHGRWCLVGTDMPQMPPLASLELENLLQQNDYVFGPASDGGFWLVAGRCTIPQTVWEAVHYSQPETLMDLRQKIQTDDPSKTIIQLSSLLTDIDRQHDLKSLVQELNRTVTQLSPRQQELSVWLKQELSANDL